MRIILASSCAGLNSGTTQAGGRASDSLKMRASRLVDALRQHGTWFMCLGGVVETCNSTSTFFPAGAGQVNWQAQTRLLTWGVGGHSVNGRVHVARRGIQQKRYSSIGHELPVLDTHHIFRIVATCSVIAAFSNSWFSGSGFLGDISTHVALLRGNSQMKIAGLQRMQRAISRKDELACFEAFSSNNAFQAVMLLMRSEDDIAVWRQLCCTVVDICDSPVLRRGLVSTDVCAILSERVTNGDQEWRAAAALLVHKLVLLNGEV